MTLISNRSVAWRSTVITALVHSTFQVAGFGLAMLAWSRSPGWTSGQWLSYFALLSLACPLAARGLAKRILHLRSPFQAWRVWAVSFFTLLVLLFTEGFAEAGVHPAVVLTIMAALTFFGGLASSWSRYEYGRDVGQS